MQEGWGHEPAMTLLCRKSQQPGHVPQQFCPLPLPLALTCFLLPPLQCSLNLREGDMEVHYGWALKMPFDIIYLTFWKILLSVLSNRGENQLIDGPRTQQRYMSQGQKPWEPGDALHTTAQKKKKVRKEGPGEWLHKFSLMVFTVS